MNAVNCPTVDNVSQGLLNAKPSTLSMFDHNNKKVTVPINEIFNIDFINSTIARIEKIRFSPLIGSIFFKSNFNGSVVNKKPN